MYLEDINDEDYTRAQKIFKELKLKNLGDYHDLYVQSDTLLKTLEISVLKYMNFVLKYMNLILLVFCPHQD